MTHDVKDRTAAVGDWFPPGFVEAVGHTLVILRGILAVGLIIVALLIWIGVEVTSLAGTFDTVSTLVSRR